MIMRMEIMMQGSQEAEAVVEDVGRMLGLLMTQMIASIAGKVGTMPNIATRFKKQADAKSGKLQHGNYTSSSHENKSENLFAM